MRFGNTGDWLFKQEAFTQWRDAAFEESHTPDSETRTRSWLDGILSLQGKFLEELSPNIVFDSSQPSLGTERPCCLPR